MKTAQAVRYFGGNRAALARALGIRRQSVAEWGERVPRKWWADLEELSRGALKRPKRLPLPYLPPVREARA